MDVMKYVVWANYGQLCEVFDNQKAGWYVQKQKALSEVAVLEKEIPQASKPSVPFKNPLKL